MDASGQQRIRVGETSRRFLAFHPHEIATMASGANRGKGRRSPRVEVPMPSASVIQSPPSSPLNRPRIGGQWRVSHRNATPGPSNRPDWLPNYEESDDEPDQRESKRRCVIEITDDEEEEDALEQQHFQNPHIINVFLSTPKMTFQERQARWPQGVRLSLPDLRFLRRCPSSPDHRHEIAPYAFDNKGRPFQYFRNNGIDDQLGVEEENRIGPAIWDGTYIERVEEAAAVARQGELSAEAVRRATDIVRGIFRGGSARDPDDDIEVVAPHVWKFEVQLNNLRRKVGRLEQYERKMENMERTLETLQRSHSQGDQAGRDEVGSASAEERHSSGNSTRDAGSHSESHQERDRAPGGSHRSAEAESSTPLGHAQNASNQTERPRLNMGDRRDRAAAEEGSLDQSSSNSENRRTHLGSGRNEQPRPRLCPNPACCRLSREFRKAKDELHNLPSFLKSPLEGGTWLENVRTIARCRDVRYHSQQLIDACVRIIKYFDTPVY